MNRPTIKSPCVADRHHSPGERIAEVTFPNGKGCLLSLRVGSDGMARITVYRCDSEIEISVPAVNATVES